MRLQHSKLIMSRVFKYLMSLILVSLYSFDAQAFLYSHIYEISYMGSPNKRTTVYHYSISGWDRLASDDNTPNPCASWSKCYVTVNHVHDKSKNPGAQIEGIVEVTGLQTLREVQEKVFNTKGYPFTHSGRQGHYGDQTVDECVTLFLQPVFSSSKFEKGIMMPGALCGIAPQPVGSCSIIEDSIDIDYKEINESNLNNATKEAVVNLACDKATSVRVVAYGLSNGRVPLRNDGSLSAELYVNDVLGTTGATVDTVGSGVNVPITIKSILKTNGTVNAGEFSGAGTIILTYI
ncbi:adhesin [Providencia rettgeri]|uniref:MrpH family fimbial adhesin n=1 Tax=Providencia rettgeri TaxID=587 RepID=UPI000B16DF9B|nr:adhesin [Providencia rettgeri]